MATATAAPAVVTATTSPQPCFSDPGAASSLVGELYEVHGRMVVGLCRFLLRDSVEADDAAQQSFVSAHRSLLAGAAPRDAPAWLATIARNECRARIKRRMREPLPLLEPDGMEGQLADPFQAAAKNADLRVLRAGLEALPETQRNAFVLREFAGLSYEELAVALGVTEPAVESLLVRARTKLRLALVRANPLVVSLAVRDQLARLATGFDDGSASAVAKIVSVPLAAKLAAVGAGVALVAVGGSGPNRSATAEIARTHAPVAIAPTVEREGIAGVSSSRGSSRSSTPVAPARAHREETDDFGRGSVASVGSRAGRDTEHQETDPSSSGPGSAPVVGDGGSAPTGEPAQSDGPPTSGGTSTVDGGSEDLHGADAGVTSGAEAGSGTTSGSSGDGPSTSSEPSNELSSSSSETSVSGESEPIEKRTTESGSAEPHGSGDGSPSG